MTTTDLPRFAVQIAPEVTWLAPGTFTASARTHWAAFYRAAWKNYGITMAQFAFTFSSTTPSPIVPE